MFVSHNSNPWCSAPKWLCSSMHGFFSSLLKAAIIFYRKALSPLKPRSCRYYPTCSAYALEAIERHGAARGAVLAVKRIIRCNPFHPGGFDPVS